MATYNTASKQLLDNYACISTLEPTDIVVGQSITVASIGAPFNGTFQVLALPQYEYTGIDGITGEFLYNEDVARPNQIIYAATGSNVEYVAFYAGTVVYTQSCTWITTSPGNDVTLGTLMYAAALWRSRGSIETAYAAFDTMGTPTQQSLTPIVKQLLGIPRPAVA